MLRHTGGSCVDAWVSLQHAHHVHEELLEKQLQLA
jgi:hypothetical protein